MRVLVVILVLTALVPQLLRAQEQPNSAYDDYAPAFRRLPDGTMELWFTSSMPSQIGRSRQMMISKCSMHGFEAPKPVADAAINFTDPTRSGLTGVQLNGVPSFTCDGARGVFVSNRLVNGQDYGNDIYEMTQRPDGHWDVARIDSVNSEWWDDTPALSPDGSLIVFASDRLAPGGRRTDLFFARRLPTGWSSPNPLTAVNTDANSEEAPCIGSDGFFYYATNAHGRYQIWRASLKGGLPADRGAPLTLQGVNSDSSDATHPCLSPGGAWLLFTSNKSPKGTKDQDIYWVRTTSEAPSLRVNVQQRLRQRDPLDPSYTYDATGPLSTDVTLRDVGSGDQQTQHSDASGTCTFTLQESKHPAEDLAVHTALLSATPPSARFVSATDTLKYTTDISTPIDRTLFVWDTSSINDPSCKQTFPIADVRFFIEGYWGPTTNRYHSFIPGCTSFFDDSSSCLVTQAQCESNNLYKYEYVASRSDASNNCFNYKEFRAHGREYAEEVDGALDSLRNSMVSALRMQCVERSREANEKIEITVTGYTDPKKYRDPECAYNGMDVDFSKEFIHLIDTEAEPLFRTGTLMTARGGGGNPLLSDLRAFWTAKLLDSIWNAFVPEYHELRASGLLVLKAKGESVNKNDKLTFAQRRSISVEVRAETKAVHREGARPQPGQTVEFYNRCTPASLPSGSQ